MDVLRVVLVGVIGSGKTAFFNNLTKNQEPVKQGGASVTKQVVVGQCIFGEQFEVIDTPGFESDEEKLLHAAGVIAALSIGDVNRILLIQKFDRDGVMMNALQQVIAPITRYRDMVTVIVSHWDLSENKEQDQQHLTKKIKDRFNIGSILYYSKLNDPKVIALLVQNIIFESKLTSIKLSDTEIISQFDLSTLNYESQDKLERDKEQIIKSFRKTAQVFIKYINEEVNLDDPKAVDILHFISLEIKNIANKQVEQFEKQHGEQLNEFYDTNGINVSYLHHIYLKKEIKKDLEKVIKLAQEKMINSKNHCFQCLKQCPHCKLIWIKVAGCDGQTTCGNRVYTTSDSLLKNSSTKCRYEIELESNKLVLKEIQFSNTQNTSQKSQSDSNQDYIYQIIREDKYLQKVLGQNFTKDQFEKLIREKNDMNQNLMYSFLRLKPDDDIIKWIYQQLDIERDIEKQNDKKNKRFGCGQELIWSELPPLSGPELNELLSIELIDYFNDQAQLINDESKFLEAAYKDLVNQAIQEQYKTKKVIQLQKQSETQ
ncbi:unnamed protein product (macronuclear) [Paramecium tetraurelia]|uniref:G domain-containing protein n=1 Tax=Paramecium tetraurelia TaxID=5888 RepID=A0CEG8_PARTE|nr:uncharacterized protein GSPATT00037622001 [Paramecium tetraurelia]CAK69185.1 unnamed protein product [Paramecium tetraurelia]|eukprot:XP_001436582.1 hypothetical protein (macronuclear) [Paramecium tetraurelia strain d4-2]